MTDPSPGLSPEKGEEQGSDIDVLLVRSIARWAVVVSVLIFVYDLAVLGSYPFPDALSDLRGVFYAAFAVALVFATAATTFLGYRIVSMRVAGRSKAVYLIFLPGVILLTSIVGFLLLAAPR